MSANGIRDVEGEAERQATGPKPVLLASEADQARLEQLVYAATDSTRQVMKLKLAHLAGQALQKDGSNGSAQQSSEADVQQQAKTIMQILSACTAIAPREPEATDIGQFTPSEEDTKRLTDLQSQVAELQNRVSQLRSEAPKQLAANVESYLENNRQLLEVGQVPPLAPADQAKALRPAPANLQASLADAISKAPILRARLSETLARLERVTAALDAGKENVGANIQAARNQHGKVGIVDPEQTRGAEGLQFQKQIADSILTGRLL